MDTKETIADASSASDAKSEEEKLLQYMNQWPRLLADLHVLLKQLQRKSLRGPFNVAQTVALYLRKVLGTCAFTTIEESMRAIRVLGRKLQAASPHELVIGNITRRVLKMIRDVVSDTERSEDTGEGVASLTNLLKLSDMTESISSAYGGKFRNIKSDILEVINDEIIEDFTKLYTSLNKEAPEYVHSGEVILTYGASDTVRKFIVAAKKKCNFNVVVAESAEIAPSHKMAKALAKEKIDTTVITNSAVFTMMSRVDKVIVGARVIMANGGIIGDSGLHALALAAKHHAVPLVCVAGLFKLCPEYPFDQNTANNLLSPSDVLSFKETGEISLLGTGQLQILNPSCDYVPPSLIKLFVTDSQPSLPSYVYRLLRDIYHLDDFAL